MGLLLQWHANTRSCMQADRGIVALDKAIIIFSLISYQLLVNNSQPAYRNFAVCTTIITEMYIYTTNHYCGTYELLVLFILQPACGS